MPESQNQTDAVAIVSLPQESSSCMPHEISWKPPTYKNIPLGTGIAEEGVGGQMAIFSHPRAL